MTQRAPTAWSSNTEKLDGVAYSDPATAYSSAAVAYSSPDAAVDQFDRDPAVWLKGSKIAKSWQANPVANTNLYVFDSVVDTFDSAIQTFDGVVANQDFGNTNLPASWTKNSKTANIWDPNPAASINEYPHDSTRLYDSASRNYDGVVSGEDSLADRNPQAWSKL